MKRHALNMAAIGVTIGLIGGASAADVPAPVYTKAPVVYAPINDVAGRWTGFFVGAGIGADWPGSVGSPYADQGHAWTVGRISAGYDRQFSPSYVAGVFGDLEYSGARTDVAPDLTDVSRTTGALRREWSGDVGVRFGWLATSQVLFFAESGGTSASLRETYNHYSPADSPWSSNHTRFGWFAGGGAEAFIAKHVTFRGEYRYGEIGAGSSDPVRTVREQTALFGVAWRP